MDKDLLTPESKANLRKGDFIINTVNGDIVTEAAHETN